jgi:F420-0:gamma-glutamyl ligase
LWMIMRMASTAEQEVLDEAAAAAAHVAGGHEDRSPLLISRGVVVFGLYSSKCMCPSGTTGLLNQEMDNLWRD